MSKSMSKRNPNVPISPSKLKVWYCIHKVGEEVKVKMLIHRSLQEALEENNIPGEIVAIGAEVPEIEWRDVEVGKNWWGKDGVK